MTSRHTPKLPEHSGMSPGGTCKGYLARSANVAESKQKPPSTGSPMTRHAHQAGNEAPAPIEHWK